MYYQVTVCFKGKHLFTTSENSATSLGQALKLASEFMVRFPPSDDFKISVSKVYKEMTGYTAEEFVAMGGVSNA